MIVGVIKCFDLEKALSCLGSFCFEKFDLLELRLDYLLDINSFHLQLLKNLENKERFIFTLRKKSQGGFYQESEEKRLVLLKKLAEIGPDILI